MEKRQFTPEFKTKVVIELLRDDKLLGEIASDNKISPNQLRNWKKEFIENASRVFSESKREKEVKAKEKELEQERNELMAKVGQLTIENELAKVNDVDLKNQLKVPANLSLGTSLIISFIPSRIFFKRLWEFSCEERKTVFVLMTLALRASRESFTKSREI
jgi:transposase